MPPLHPTGPLVFGRAVLDPARRELTVGGSVRHLRAKSFDVLAYLAARPGRVVTKQELIDGVWEGAAVTDDSLVQCLIEVRRALEPEGARITTIRGKRYRFDPEGTGTPAAASQAPAPASAGDGDSALAAHDGSPWWQRTGIWWALAFALLLAGGFLGWRAMRTPAATTTSGSSAEPRLAPQVTLSAGVVQLMVTGNAAVEKRSQAALQQARQAFEQAIGLDARYAPAHAALANTLVLLHVVGAERPASVLPVAVEHADRAVELDPTYGLGWHALAHAEVHWTRDWTRAEMHYRRALALDPKAELPAFLLAHLLMGLGRGDEALAQSLRALSLNPRSPVLQVSTGIVHRFVKGDREALPYFETAWELDPTYAVGPFWRAISLAGLGRFDEAMEWALRSRDSMANTPTWLVGYVHARAGRMVAAQEVLDAMTVHARTYYVPAMEFAYLTLAMGQREAALHWIETAVTEHSRWIELMAVDPILAPLRTEPRFVAALAAMKLGLIR